MKGYEESNSQQFSSPVDVRNRQQWQHMVNQVEKLLDADTEFSVLVLAALQDIKVGYPEARLVVHLYHTRDALGMLFNKVLHGTDDYVPQLRCVVVPGKDEPIFELWGLLVWDGKTHIDGVNELESIFGSNIPWRYMTHRTQFWSESKAFHGIDWQLFRHSSEGEASRLTYANGHVVLADIEQNSIRTVATFLASNWNYACELTQLICQSSIGLDPLENILATSRVKKRLRHWHAPRVCGHCQRRLGDLILAIPVRVNDLTFICRHCFTYSGQRFDQGCRACRRSPDGSWLVLAET